MSVERQKCAYCFGSGLEAGIAGRPCEPCNGKGYVLPPEAIEASRELQGIIDQRVADKKRLEENLDRLTIHELYVLLEVEVRFSKERLIKTIVNSIDPERVGPLNESFR